MIGKEAIGVSGPVYQFPIELGKVREYAKAIDANHQIYFNEQTPPIPPGFLGIAGRFWGYTFDDPGDTDLAQLDIDRSIRLHAEEEYEFYSDYPKAGDTLAVRTYIKDVFTKQNPKGKMVFVVSETEFKDQNGNLIAHQRQTVVKV